MNQPSGSITYRGKIQLQVIPDLTLIEALELRKDKRFAGLERLTPEAARIVFSDKLKWVSETSRAENFMSYDRIGNRILDGRSGIKTLDDASPLRIGPFAIYDTSGKMFDGRMETEGVACLVPDGYRTETHAGHVLVARGHISIRDEQGKKVIEAEITNTHKFPKQQFGWYLPNPVTGIPEEEARTLILPINDNTERSVELLRLDAERKAATRSLEVVRSPGPWFGEFACGWQYGGYESFIARQHPNEKLGVIVGSMGASGQIIGLDKEAKALLRSAVTDSPEVQTPAQP